MENLIKNKIKLICLMLSYNKQDILPKSIESVVMQKTDFPYKLVVVDDCSTDCSYQIALDYQKKYPDKIQVIRNEKNLGILGSTLNCYAQLAGMAEYFCFLDSDDWYTYDLKFQEAVTYLEEHRDYTCYATNILLKSRTGERPWINFKGKELDLDYETGKSGRNIFVQTSGSIFRNVFRDLQVAKMVQGVTALPFAKSFYADGFRQNLALSLGKMHFKNEMQSVYNFSGDGEYSKLSDAGKEFENILMFYSFAYFFTDDKAYYLDKFSWALKSYAIKYGEEGFALYQNELKELKKYLTVEEFTQLLLSADENKAKKIKKLKYRIMKKVYDYCQKKLRRKGYIA